MKMRLWPYFFRQAVMSIANNLMVHAIGMCTMVVSLLILGTFLILFVNLDNWIQGWGHSLSMTVYLKDDITESQRSELRKHLEDLSGAEIKRYISKEQAMQDIRLALGSQAGLLEGLKENPLPASFEVVFQESNNQEIDPESLKVRIESMEGVDEVQYSEEWLKRFEGLMKMVRLVGLVIGGLLCMGVLFIIMNTIKLTIYSRREEIEILKLVGATDWFVKTPFLLEGMLQGLLSGALSLAILFSGYLLLSTKKMHFLGFAVLDFNFLPQCYSISIMLVSVLLGVVGSLVAVGSFFDV